MGCHHIKNELLLRHAVHGRATYPEFRFEYEGGSISDLVERLDTVMTNSMYKIKERNPDDYIYGLGLSGGLDSRVVLHYAKKVGMNVKCYIYGDMYPHKLFASRDYKNAILVGNVYGINQNDITMIEPEGDLVTNFIRDCKEYPHNPILPKNIVGMFFDRYPGMDFHLSGIMAGESMGALIPDTFKMDAADVVLKHLSLLAPLKHKDTFTCIPGIMDTVEFESLRQVLIDHLSIFDDTVTAVYSYLYNNVAKQGWGNPGFRTRGPWETFSPFYEEEYLKEIKTCKLEWLDGQTIQREFHKYVVPELCSIPNQRWAVPFRYQNMWYTSVAKLWYMGMFALRWNSLRYHPWLYMLRETRFAKDLLYTELESFDALFDFDKVALLPKYMSLLVASLLKMKFIACEREGVVIHGL